MWLFSILLKYLLPLLIGLLAAQNSTLGAKNGALVVGLIFSLCSILQFFWLLFRAGANLLLIRGRRAALVSLELFILFAFNIGLWIWILNIH